MADKIDPQQHLDDHYGDLDLRFVDEPIGGGKGLTPAEASSFLKRLKPVTRAVTTLAQAAKKAAGKG